MLPFIARKNRVRPLHSHGDITIWRGWESIHGVRKAVLAILPGADQPAPSCLQRLQHEYGLRDALESGWAARPLELVWEEGRPMLLLEDPGGEFLDGLLGNPMPVGVFLRLALGLTRAAGKLHQHGLIHKDLKPVHILVDGRSGAAWLTGFGHASRLPRERQLPDPPETIAGTLAYMAPEQTGRMNRAIDSRSDLYTLGVILYQMLTGSLPFNAADPLEWLHCHIARQPVPPAELAPAIPAALSAIVMKLLAKTAEERYQTAAGLENDLRRCLMEWEARGCISDFPLGQREIPDRLLIPEKLYGREREVETLIAAFNRVADGGKAELVLVSGYSGIGKTSVVNELHKVLAPPRALFASGKFEQYKRDIPYATLVQAFQSLLRPLLSKSDVELSKWRAALLEALGPNGRLMADMIPELKLIIGEQPPVAELPPQDAQRRFQLVFRRFIGVFARPEHPLALFLDDLQWLDAATLDLLEDLLIQPDLRHLLLIGAYRDNEVNSSHPLVRKLDAIKAAGGKVEEITLVPLAPEHLGQLIGDALRCELQRAAPLAKLVHEKTGGNPFFAIQFLSHLAEESLLSFDHDAASWSWDPARIHAKGCTDNAVELMTGKLQRLPAETLNVLRHFACLGNSARVKTLSAVLGTSEDEVHAALWPAVSQELVWRLDGAYRFSHDRVQEAAYSSVPEAQRAEAHLRIGKLLAAQTPPEKREESIFEIAGQLNRGAGLITSQEEREQLAEFNLIAGKRAKGSTAFTSALSYLIAGAALLAEDSWERRYELAFQLDLQRAECEFLTGELAAAEERLMGVSDRALNLVDLAAVTCLQEDLFTTTGRSDCSVEVALDYLRRVGIEWKAHPVKDEVKREYERFWQQLGDRPIEALLDLSEATAPLYRATMDVLTAVVAPALFTDQNLYCLVIGRMANLALERGNIDGSCYAYALLGSVLGPQFGNFNAGFQFGNLAVELVEKRGLDRFKARVYMMAGNHIVPWTKPIRTGRGLVRGAITAAQGAGDLTYAAYSGTHFVTHLLASGDPLPDVQREAEAALDFARKARFGLVFDRITGKLQLIRTLRGLTPIFGAFDDAEFDESRFERHLEEDPRLALAACWYWIHKLQARFFAGANDDATLASANAERLLWTSPTVFERAEYHFYAALARAAFCNAASAAERIKQLEALSAHHRQLEEWAKNCPENFESRAALAGAEIAWIEGRVLEAMDLYEQAIRSARASGFVQNEALANELAARFYGARGFETISQTYLRNARHCYLRWGANGKVRQLDHFYPQLRDEPPVAGPTGTIEAPVEQLDLATVIKVSQAVSGEIVPEKLIDTIMRTAMAQAGAVRALLILTRGDEQRIAAEASADGDAVSLCQRDEAVSGATLPEAVLRYVLRTRECIILDDAAAEPRFVADPYIRQHKARSILCLPLINQAKLIGVLYLENNLAPRVFAPARIAVLKLLASQAAITLENAHLYLGLAEREAKIRRLVDSNIIGSFTFQVPSDGPDTGDPAFGEVNDAFLRMLGYDREEFASCCRRRSELTPPEWRDRDKRTISELREFGVVQPFEKKYFRKDGSRLPVLAGFASFDETRTHGVAFVLDLTGRKRAEKELRTLAEERALLEDALNHSHEGAYINDSAGRFLYVNDEACRALGYSREELLALCVPDIDPNYPAERVALTLRETREKGPVTIETRHRRKDGRIFPVELTLSAFDYGGKNYYIALARDITERKRVEGELRTLAEQRAIMEGALNQSHEGAYLIDGEAHFLYVNDEACRALGYSRAELLAMRVPDIDPDYPVERYKAVFEDVLKNRPVAFETKHRRKDGRTFPVEITGSAFKYAEKDYFIALARNITERKRTENALRRSEAYLAEAQRLTRMGSWASDGASREPIYWSEEMFRLYGLDPQSGLPPQDPAMTLVHPEDRDKLEQASDSVFVGKADLDVEFRIVLSDGAIKYIHALAHPVVDANGQVVEVVGTLADITERKRTEEALRRSEAYLAEAQKLTRTGSWAWDPCRDWILHCSEEIFRIYGIDPRHGMPAFEMLMQRVHPDDHDRIIESTLEGARKKEERLIQYRIVLPDGTLKYIESVRRPVLDAAGNVVEIVGTSIDVTERKRDEEERERLRKLEADLAHVDRISMLGELAASLAHEIKQPITGAVTSANACLRWLARHPPDLEKARAAALRIERDGTRAAEVINRLRAFYKKDTPAQRGLIDVNAVIREMIALLHSEAIQHSISIRHELADCIPRIIADRVQLQQVLMNLMLNAIEAMRGTDRELTIRSRLHADDQLLISVGDTGVGFPAEDAEYIFDPFFTTKPQGTGMGLAITRSLVESHGGRVWATPNTGPGATFYFTLPIRDKANE